MPRPKSDLSAITVSKEPIAALPVDDTEGPVHTRTLSLRLTDDDYRGLLRLASVEQERTGRRVSNQSLLERAVREFLKTNGVLRGCMCSIYAFAAVEDKCFHRRTVTQRKHL